MNRWKYVLVGLLVGAFAFPLVWNSDPSVIGQTVTVDSTQSPLVVNALADLANLTPTDGQSVIIKTGTEKGLWYYDKDSVAVVDSVAVLTGPGSVGRFLVINNDAGSIAAATAITAAQIDNDVDLEFGVFDADSPRSLTLAELKKTGVQVINVKQYGATGDGVTDDTVAIEAALRSAVSGDVVYFPAGTYNFLRDNSDTETILDDNVTVIGDGDGTVLNNTYTEAIIGRYHWNLIYATSRTGITIRNLRFTGFTSICKLDTCSNVVIDNVSGNGKHADDYLHDHGIGLLSCTNVQITKCRLLNYHFHCFLGGSSPARCSNVTVSGCTFENNHTFSGDSSAYAPFPVGVYLVYADNVTVSGNTFTNIYSSKDSGDSTTGIGYGVYEGDGASTGFAVSGNVFNFTGNGSKNATAIWTYNGQRVSITGNVIRGTTGCRNGIRCNLATTDTVLSITGNTIETSNVSGDVCIFVRASVGTGGRANVTGNLCKGGNISASGNSSTILNIANNIVDTAPLYGMIIQGSTGSPIKNATISNNVVRYSQQAGIVFTTCVQTSLTSNSIRDINLSNAAGDSGAGILFSTNAHGSVIRGNSFMNTIEGAGNMKYGVSSSANAVSRPYKDLVAGNTFSGLNDSSTHFRRYWSVVPTTGIYDIEVGDYIQNAALTSSAGTGWTCTKASLLTLSSNASATDTTITVSSTSGMLVGDLVMFVFDTSNFSTLFTDTLKWHSTSVASVTNGTQFVIADAIPASHSYVAGTAVLKIARMSPTPKSGATTAIAGQTTLNASRSSVITTANTGGTVVSSITGAIAGETVTVVIGDINTTIDFTGTTLKGNGGADWTPTTGDHMTCTYDGTNWYCVVSDNTP